MRKASLFLLLIAVGTLTGCKSVFDKRVSEGVLTYDVTYPGTDPDDVFAGLRPDEMTLHFKKDVYMAEMTGGMGMFKTTFISDPHNRQLINTVKLLSKKYAIVLDEKGVQELNAPYASHSILHLDETKMIAGIECKAAVILFDDKDMGEVYVYYTDQIKMKTPNWASPFKDIPGVLMEYEMNRYDMRMKFSASELVEEEIDQSLLELPDDYKKVSPKVFDEEIETIMDTFQ